MRRLDGLLLALLSASMTRARDLARDGQIEEAAIELDYTHNIPTLIGETNRLRLWAFVKEDKVRYIDAITRLGSTSGIYYIRNIYSKYWVEISEEIQNINRG
jgi:hypothetical protein